MTPKEPRKRFFNSLKEKREPTLPILQGSKKSSIIISNIKIDKQNAQGNYSEIPLITLFPLGQPLPWISTGMEDVRSIWEKNLIDLFTCLAIGPESY